MSKKRAMYPEPEPVERFGDRVDVTVSLDADVYERLKKIVGRDSYMFCVEEALISAARAMTGEVYLIALAESIAISRRVTVAEVMHGGLRDNKKIDAANMLLRALRGLAMHDLVDGLEGLMPAIRERLIDVMDGALGGDSVRTAWEAFSHQPDLFDQASLEREVETEFHLDEESLPF